MTANGIRNARSASRGALLSFLALLPACGDNDELSARPPRPVPGCEQHEVAACDTQNFACQQRRLALAACMRGVSTGALPRVTVMTEQDYVDYLNAKYEGTDLRINHFEVAMTWLGLAQAGSFDYQPLTRDDIKDWFGTYRWREDDLLRIDHGRPADDAASNVALVESLILSLRDRTLDIGTWSNIVSIVDVDSIWGGNAMYFGEARFYSNRYKAALQGIDPARFDELAPIEDGLQQDIDWIRAQPSTYVATNSRFSHNFGARAMYLAWQRDGIEGVNGLFDDKLLTHQLMASETEALAAPPVTHHSKPTAPEVWYSEPNITAIGAWGLYLSLSQHQDPEAAWAMALEWRGDTVYVYRSLDPDTETALVWQVETSDKGSAAALAEALSAGVPGAEVQRQGSFVTLAITTDQSDVDWAFVEE